MMGHSAAVFFALAMMAVGGDTEVSSLTHDKVALGQTFQIETTDQVFRGQLLDRTTGECQMTISSGGRFAPRRTVYLLGATAGPQDRQMLVLMHEVKVGLRMELGLDDLDQKHRLITGEVRTIKLLR